VSIPVVRPRSHLGDSEPGGLVIPVIKGGPPRREYTDSHGVTPRNRGQRNGPRATERPCLTSREYLVVPELLKDLDPGGVVDLDVDQRGRRGCALH